MCSTQTLIERKVHLLKVFGSCQKVVVEISNNKNLMSRKIFLRYDTGPSKSCFQFGTSIATPTLQSPTRSNWNEMVFFPTCQVRVVRFYVSLFSSSSRTPPPPPSSSSSCRDPVSSVWRAGLQPRAREFSVACRTPTAILRVQCGVPDPNRDPASSVWRAGPQL